MADPVQPATVLGVRDLTPSVRELLLAPRERPIDFAPGQWVSLKLPVGPRPPLVRAYSMAEPPSASGHLRLVLDRVPGGLGSNFLFGLRPGDEVPLSGPHGSFQLPQPLPPSLLLVARYTGIVPIRCMLLALSRSGPLPACALVYVLPSKDDLLYDEEFRALAQAHPSFRYRPVIGTEADGRSAVAEALEASAGARPFPMIAGVKQFVRPLRAWLMERGYDRRGLRYETYD